MFETPDTGAPGAHQDIADFAARFADGGWPEAGETFVRNGAVFTVLGGSELIGAPVVVVESNCLTCGAPFIAAVNWHPMGTPVGSCPAHRLTPRGKPSQPDAHQPKRKRRSRAKQGAPGPRKERIGLYGEAVLQAIDALELVYGREIDTDALVAYAVSTIPPPPPGKTTRDVRRQSCWRALEGLRRRRGWDRAAGVLYLDGPTTKQEETHG